MWFVTCFMRYVQFHDEGQITRKTLFYFIFSDKARVRDLFEWFTPRHFNVYKKTLKNVHLKLVNKIYKTSFGRQNTWDVMKAHLRHDVIVQIRPNDLLLGIKSDHRDQEYKHIIWLNYTVYDDKILFKKALSVEMRRSTPWLSGFSLFLEL